MFEVCWTTASRDVDVAGRSTSWCPRRSGPTPSSAEASNGPHSGTLAEGVCTSGEMERKPPSSLVPGMHSDADEASHQSDANDQRPTSIVRSGHEPVAACDSVLSFGRGATTLCRDGRLHVGRHLADMVAHDPDGRERGTPSPARRDRTGRHLRQLLAGITPREASMTEITPRSTVMMRRPVRSERPRSTVGARSVGPPLCDRTLRAPLGFAPTPARR